VYCRDPAVLLKPALRLKWLRFLSNAPVVILLGAFVVVIALKWSRLATHNMPALLAVLLAALAVLLGFPGVMIQLFVFRIGRISCPCCGEPFAPSQGFWIGRSCDRCGFDCVTMHRPGDF